MARKPAVVAELGRPETPEEKAARLAENSRKYRARKTIQNLIAAVGVSLLAVLIMVLIVPRNDNPRQDYVDYAQVARDAQPGQQAHLVVPELDESWRANEAEMRTGADKVSEWYIGLLQVSDDKAQAMVGVRQGLAANETWRYTKTGERPATGTVEIGGMTWDEYDYSSLERSEVGNNGYVLANEHNGSVYIVFSSHDPALVHEVAEAVAADMQ